MNKDLQNKIVQEIAENPPPATGKHLWRKGQSGNPAGRKKKGNTFNDVLETMLNSKAVSVVITLPDGSTKTLSIKADAKLRHALSARLIMAGLSGDISAIREINDRLYGKPVQQVNAKVESDTSAQVVVYAPKKKEWTEGQEGQDVTYPTSGKTDVVPRVDG